jgi:hypothetical protein
MEVKPKILFRKGQNLVTHRAISSRADAVLGAQTMVLEALLAVLVSVAIASLLLAVAETATILFIARMVSLLFAFTARMIMCLCTSACPGIDPDLANLGASKLAEHGISPGVFATAWAAWGLVAVRVLRRLAQRMWSEP